jgi:hypothetical protein
MADYLLSLSECQAWKRVFHENCMSTFADWLRHFNYLDVAPFNKAQGKMKAFCAERGIDIFKDVTSLPGISL